MAFLEFVRTERGRLARGRTGPVPAWEHACDELLVDARAALAADETERAWESALRARQYTILGYGRHELAAEVHELRPEAEQKLAGWRRTAVLSALDAAARHLGPSVPARGGQLPAAPSEDALHAARALIARASGIRDQGGSNEHRRDDVVQRNLAILVGFFVAALVAFLALLIWMPIDLGADIARAEDEVWAWAFVFGVVGGTLTAFLSTAAGLGGRVPRARLDARILTVRPLVGGVAALVAYTLLVAELVQIGNGSVAAVLVVAFAAGLSERVVTGAAGALAGNR